VGIHRFEGFEIHTAVVNTGRSSEGKQNSASVPCSLP
jgi:hypothetical protein